MMDSNDEQFDIRFPVALEDIDGAELAQLVPEDEPFLRPEFLTALENSGCVSDATGWRPYHFALFDRDNTLVAFAPMYVKKHSYGEYVFDWAWADAYQRNGFNYYPKLLSSIPFTPSVSTRLLVKSGHAEAAATCFQGALRQACSPEGFSSAHILFPCERDAMALVCSTENGQGDWLKREGVQYHWFNRGYDQFDDFLAQLNSSKRKNIRKERRALKEAGLSYAWHRANDLSSELFERFIECYERTYLVRGQMAYLNARFFQLLFKSMGDRCLLLFAFDADEQPIASALFIRGENTLYGRYWGALRSIPFLHFELCYYAGIDYCIANNLQRFDAGAQGEHKLLRGFEPVRTQSWHHIGHPEFRQAIHHFLDNEREHIEQYREEARRWLPYKKEDFIKNENTPV